MSDLQVDDGTGLYTPTTRAPAVEPVGTSSCGRTTTTTTPVLKGRCWVGVAAASPSVKTAVMDGVVPPRRNTTDSESAGPTADAMRLTGPNDGSATSSTAHSGTDSNPGVDENAGRNDCGATRHGTLAGVASEAGAAAGRWDSVRLKDVKELAPRAEYWEIRMVLARLKSGYRTQC